MERSQPPQDTFGAVLKRHRIATGWTQEELAARAEVSVRTIRTLEHELGTLPRGSTAWLLAQAFGLSDDARDAFLTLATSATATAKPASPPAAAPGEPAPDSATLPFPATPLIGREQVVADVCALFDEPDVRLVTLTGAGGVGKTRVALAVAHAAARHAADDAAWVALASLSDPGLIALTIGHALGLAESTSLSPEVALRAFLRTRRLLLVLDNAEHLVPALGVLLAELLSTCGALRLLVTSRVPLHLQAEHSYHVLPLHEASAVELFTARARALLHPAVALASTELPAIHAICRRLDGLPLALELAAARLRLFSPTGLLERLEEQPSLPLLTGGPVDLPVRHQTLRATLAWSYQLLPVPARDVFRRLAVFAGGCTVEAAERVRTPTADAGAAGAAADPGHAAPGDRTGGATPVPVSVLDALAILVEHQLVQVAGTTATPAVTQASQDSTPPPGRLTMLETIREYGAELLQAADDAEDIRCAHAQYYCALAEAAEVGLVGHEQATWKAQIEQEHPNLRQALGWAIERKETLLALRITAAVSYFWVQYSYLVEGRHWIEAVLPLTTTAHDPARHDQDHAVTDTSQQTPGGSERAASQVTALHAKLLDRLSGIARIQGDLARARTAAASSLALCQLLGDRRGMATALNGLGNAAEQEGNLPQAIALFTESLALGRAVGDDVGVTTTLTSLAHAYLDVGDSAMAEQTARDCLSLARHLGLQVHISFALATLARVAWRMGDAVAARAHAEEGLAVRRQLGHPRGVANSLGFLGELAVARGDLAEGQQRYREGLVLVQQLGISQGIAEFLEAFAFLRQRQNHLHEAVLFLAAAAQLRATKHIPPRDDEQPDLDDLAGKLSSTLGARAFLAAWIEGERASLDEVVAAALE